MSTTLPTRTDNNNGSSCPAWCQDHPATGEDVTEHRALIPLPALSSHIEVCQDDGGRVIIFLPDAESFAPEDLRPLIAALHRTVDTLEGVGPDEAVCDHCAPHFADAFDAGYRAGRRSTRPVWAASCSACGWTSTTTDYSAAGEAARAHGDTCPDANTTVTAVGA